MPRCYIVKKQIAAAPPASVSGGGVIPYGRLTTNGLPVAIHANGNHHHHQPGGGSSSQITIIGGGGGGAGIGTSSGATEVGNVIVKHTSSGNSISSNGTAVVPGGVICSPTPAGPGTGNVIILNSVSVISSSSSGSSGGSSGTLGSVISAGPAITGASILGGGGTAGSTATGGVIHRIVDDTAGPTGPTSPTEACVAPIYYTNLTAENQNGKSISLFGSGLDGNY